MNCPICDSKVEIKENADYCSHVVFVYIWAESDSFVYVKKDFAEKYIDNLKPSIEYQDYHEENEYDIDEQAENAFKTGELKPFDEKVFQIPYFENIALNTCSSQAKLYSAEGYYSGVIVCIDKK